MVATCHARHTRSPTSRGLPSQQKKETAKSSKPPRSAALTQPRPSTAHPFETKCVDGASSTHPLFKKAISADRRLRAHSRPCAGGEARTRSFGHSSFALQHRLLVLVDNHVKATTRGARGPWQQRDVFEHVDELSITQLRSTATTTNQKENAHPTGSHRAALAPARQWPSSSVTSKTISCVTWRGVAKARQVKRHD